jgi:hypothetical protein
MPSTHKHARVRRASPTQRLLTLTQASESYGVPQRSLNDLVLRGILPAIRFADGGRLWLDRGDIEKLIATSREVRT